MRESLVDATILSPTVTLASAFVAASALVYLVLGRWKATDEGLKTRLDELKDSDAGPEDAARGARVAAWRPLEGLVTALAAIGRYTVPARSEKQLKLQKRLLQAGIYSPAAMAIYTATWSLLALSSFVAIVALERSGVISGKMIVYVGAGLLWPGLVGPGLWLDRRKSERQKVLRRSLPDFMDLIVACLESGMSLESALQRVSDELATAHPMLAGEMRILQRETALGRPVELALQHIADRTGLDAIKSFAMFVQQSRRTGGSMVESIRTNAETLRTQREQRAEELAQKAAVKILFPTLFFIFPVILAVLVGPAAIEIHEKLLAWGAQPAGAAAPPAAAATIDSSQVEGSR
jgi:tight adherence protein C